jgi:hypothetical protein
MKQIDEALEGVVVRDPAKTLENMPKKRPA